MESSHPAWIEGGHCGSAASDSGIRKATILGLGSGLEWRLVAAIERIHGMSEFEVGKRENPDEYNNLFVARQ